MNAPAVGHSEWFWRAVAGLLIVALVWVVWVIVQLQPRALVTDQAFRAADNARRSPPAPRPIEVAKAAESGKSAEPAPLPKSSPPREFSLKLAYSIETPIREPAPTPETAALAAEPLKPAPEPRKPAAEPLKPAPEPRKPAPERPASAASEYQKAVSLIRQERFQDAEAHLQQALKLQPDHLSSRRALILVLTKLGRFDEASKLIEQGPIVDQGSATGR